MQAQRKCARCKVTQCIIQFDNGKYKTCLSCRSKQKQTQKKNQEQKANEQRSTVDNLVNSLGEATLLAISNKLHPCVQAMIARMDTVLKNIKYLDRVAPPTAHISDDNLETVEICCLCKKALDGMVRVLDCGHKYHDQCLLSLALSRDTCAKCETSFAAPPDQKSPLLVFTTAQLAEAMENGGGLPRARTMEF